jgi:hypothetical protein
MKVQVPATTMISKEAAALFATEEQLSDVILSAFGAATTYVPSGNHLF